MVQKILIIGFFLSLVLGQLSGIMLHQGVVIYAHDFTLMIILAHGIVRRKSFTYKNAGLKTPITIFVLVSFFSLLLNSHVLPLPELGFSSLYLVRWLFYACIYFYILQSSISSEFWFWGLYSAGIAVASLGLIQYVTYPTLRNLYYLGWDEHYYRLFSTFFDPNYLGGFLMLCFFLGMYLVTISRKKILLYLSQILLFVSILLTYSRSTYVSVALGILLWFIYLHKTKRGIVLSILFIVMLFILPTRGKDILKITRLESAVSRIDNWHKSFRLFTEKPFLGHGFNTMRYIQLERGWVSESHYISRSAAGVDNSLLFVAITTGIVGLSSFIYLLFQFMQIVFVGLRDKKFVILRASVYVSLCSLILHSMFVNSLFYPWIMLWMWILIGAVERIIISDT